MILNDIPITKSCYTGRPDPRPMSLTNLPEVHPLFTNDTWSNPPSPGAKKHESHVGAGLLLSSACTRTVFTLMQHVRLFRVGMIT